MVQSYIVAIVGVAVLMTGWALVQRMWGRLFNPEDPTKDVLAERRACGNCGCAQPCGGREIDPDQGKLSPTGDLA